jgi:hypothetical protein
MIGRFVIRTFATALLLTAAAAGAGCDDGTTPTSPITSPVVDTFASQLTPLGTASRGFSVRETGSVVVTLTSVAPTAIVGLGLGIPRADGSGCNLAQSIETGAGPDAHIATTAEGGSYCVKVYDPGRLPGPVSFSVTIQRP